MNQHQYYVYFLTNKRCNVLYIGVTNNLSRRIWEHRNKIVGGFTKKYCLTRLVYFEVCGHVIDAIEREKQFKKWNREKKNKLVNDFNPEWKDLYESIC